MKTPFPLRCWTEIDLAILAENVRNIRRNLPPRIRYISVVKADSYGLGARQTVPALRSAGAGIFAVANLAEAAEIREFDPQVPILLLSATTPDEDPFLWQLNLIPTVSIPEEVRRYQKLSERFGPLAVHVKIDTGMGRLGTWHEQTEKLAAALVTSPGLKIAGFYSHFASAGENPEFTAEQRRRFLHALRRLASHRNPGQLIHIDNSSGLATFLGSEYAAPSPWNAVRVGLLQFGVLPAANSPLQKFETRPALSWHAKITVVKTLPAGTSVGYGQTRRLDRETRIAVVAAGYADGISRACSNRAFLLVHGRRCPILGTVTMDEIMIDVSEIPEVSCGDTATLIGQQKNERITINEFSDWSQTIPWEVLCSIGKRVPRIYR